MTRAVRHYCAARGGRGARRAAAAPAGGPAADVMTREDISAVIGNVRLEDFCGPEADARMGDLAWVGPRAQRHLAVIETVMGCSPVLPARFATVFPSCASLAGAMNFGRPVILEFLERVAGHQEWAVKVMLDRDRAAEAMLADQEPSADLAGLSPGRRYLEERRRRAQAERGLEDWTRDICQVMAAELGAGASRMCERKLLGPGNAMVLNLALLWPSAAIWALRSAVAGVSERVAGRGLRLELSGPWPPFSFVPPVMPPGMDAGDESSGCRGPAGVPPRDAAR